jgi:hypothetical protein
MDDASKKRLRAARRLAGAEASATIGGAAFAADRSIEAVDDEVERAGRALDEARATDQADSVPPYEARTRRALLALAAERGIPGRARMRKAELIAVLRERR